MQAEVSIYYDVMIISTRHFVNEAKVKPQGKPQPKQITNPPEKSDGSGSAGAFLPYFPGHALSIAVMRAQEIA